MSILKKRVSKSFISSLIIGFLILYTILPMFLPKTNAGTFTSASITVSDSRSSHAATQYDLAFTASATTSIKQINIKFCTEAGAFADTCTAPSGFDLASPLAVRNSENIAGTGRTDSQPAANNWQTIITTPSTQSTQAITFQLTNVTNPSNTNVPIYTRIITYSDTGTTEIDQVTTAFALLTSTSIAVTATVNATMSFSLAAVNTGTVNGATITESLSATATTIPWATLVDATPKILAHDVTVATNALNGFTVSVKSDAVPPMTNGGSQNFDAFSGTYGSPTTWTSPAGTSASVNTGFFGYTTADTDHSGFQTNKWAGFETTARTVITGASGSDTTRLGWQVEVNEAQPPGTYSGTVILVATPTY